MGKLKLFENILKAVSTLAAALISFVKFIGMAFSMKTEKAQFLLWGILYYGKDIIHSKAAYGKRYQNRIKDVNRGFPCGSSFLHFVTNTWKKRKGDSVKESRGHP